MNSDEKSEGILENLEAENAFITERELEMKAFEAQLKRDNWVECRTILKSSRSTCHFNAAEYTIPTSGEDYEIEKPLQNIVEKNPVNNFMT